MGLHGVAQRVVFEENRAMRRLMFLLLLFSLEAWAVSVDKVVPPRPGHWVSDATGTLSAKDIAALDALGSELDQSGKGQLAVVLVGSTDGRVPRTYATELFNRWGIGHATKNNGVLLFLA